VTPVTHGWGIVGMSTLVRALTYATVFVGLLLVFLPAQLLDWSGVNRPTIMGVSQIIGAIVTLAGAALALWCVLTFALVGRGTPAPFDPPRRLVRSGPYRRVRNPMYIGAGLALGGAALFYRSLALLAYALGFMVAAHLFVILYEERSLARLFPKEYGEYRRRVRRWLPAWRAPAV
jgi:protein-S-isoprenylcysteine O-methyltransferase Ste14